MSRSTVIGLGIVCIILLVGLVGAMLYYNMQMKTLSNDKNALTNYNSQLETWLAGNITQLQNQYNDYVASHHYTESEYNSLSSQNTNLQGQVDSLQNQVNSLEAPKLIEVNLKADDNRPSQQQTYLHVYGYVCNVGTDTAYNAILYVEAFQGTVLTFNTTISLGTINGGSYTSVNSQVVYPGNFLTSWRVWSSPTGINLSWG